MDRIVTSLMSRAMRGTVLVGLDDDQRRRINRSLCGGEAVDDPGLAAPLVRQADRMLDMAVEIPVKLVVLAAVMATVAAGGLLVLGFARGEGLRWFPVVVVAGSLLMLYVVPRTNRLWRHVTQSRKATKDRWDVRS